MSDDDYEFMGMVAYFYEEKGDPTRFTRWDAERCARLMPDFFFAWSMAKKFRRLADIAIKEQA